jgi:hypothetical protein
MRWFCRADAQHIRRVTEQIEQRASALNDDVGRELSRHDARLEMIRRRAAIRWPDDDPATGRHHQSDIHGGNAPGGAG